MALKAHSHEVSASMQSQRCDDTCETALIGVVPK